MAFAGSITGAPLPLEAMKWIGEDGQLRPHFETLAKDIPIYSHLYWMRSDQVRSFTFTQPTSVPSPTVKTYNQGYDTVYTDADPTKVPIMTAGGWVKIDEEVMRDIGTSAFGNHLWMQEKSAIRGFTEQMVIDMFNSVWGVTPNKFNGMAQLRNALDSGVYVIDAGGTGSDLCSMYLVDHSEGGVMALYPEDSMIGIQRTDFGKGIVTDDNGKEFPGYRLLLKLNYGLALGDQKCLVRIANIDATDAAFTFNEDWVIDALGSMRGQGMNAKAYCNMTLYRAITKAAKNKNAYQSETDPFGRRIERMFGVPVFVIDTTILTNTESALT